MKLINIKKNYGLYDVSNDEFKEVKFPYSKYRKYQRVAIEQIAHILMNNDNSSIFLDAPTGAGKSIIPVMATYKAGYKRILIATSNKLLQLQYHDMLRKFADLNDLKMTYIMGRNNYMCKINSDLTADDCIDNEFFKCPYKPQLVEKSISINSWLLRNGKYRYYAGKMDEMCPYWKDKINALNSDIVLMNTSYLVYEAFYSKEIMPFDVVVIDEFHRFDDVLTQLLTLEFSHNFLKKLDIYFSDEIITDKDEVISVLNLIKNRLVKYISNLNKKISKMEDKREMARYVKYYEYLKKKVSMINRVVNDLKKGINIIIDSNQSGVRFRYLDVRGIFKEIIQLSKVGFIGMSATLNSPEYINERYDISKNFKYSAYIIYPYTFPLKNRIIIRTTGIRVNYKNEDEVKFLLFEIIRQMIDIIVKYKENMLVHTVSNKLKNQLIEYLVLYDEKFETKYTNVILSHDNEYFEDNLYDVYNRFKNERGKVLISSAMTEGVDLPDDECRVQVVLKVPLLDIGDKLNKYLFEKYPDRYFEKSIIILSQMFGRNIRHESDSGITFILDSKVAYLITKYREKFKSYDLSAMRSIDVSQINEVLENYITKKKFVRPKASAQFSKRLVKSYDFFDDF